MTTAAPQSRNGLISSTWLLESNRISRIVSCVNSPSSVAPS